MKRTRKYPVSTIVVVASLFAGLQPAAFAQIVPDDTLPERSILHRNGSVQEITGGTTRGGNLFHSFEQFSLPTGETAFFNNASAIQNILTRITGSSVSTIDGLMRANGSANLFLLNPNGIIFGSNAQLDIGGSFISSTADRIRFADGSEFSAVAPQASSLLTISVPTGLQYGANPGAIRVQGSGNHLRLDQDNLSVIRDDRPVGLQVQSGQTLALLGGDVVLAGGNLTAAEGRVELGSVGRQSVIALIPTTSGWTTQYTGVNAFRDIRLSQAASVDVSGDRGGSIQVQGRQVTLTGGSTLLANTLGSGRGGTIRVHATESMTLRGIASPTASDTFPFTSSIFTEVNAGAAGSGGRLNIQTDQLRLFNGAQISASTSGLGAAGDLTVTARQIELAGEANSIASGLFTVINDVGDGEPGNLTVTADRLVVRDGAQIGSSTFAAGNAGNIVVSAQTIDLRGAGANVSSGLFAATYGDGTGGQLTVNTNRLRILDGAEISTNTFGAGNAGDLTVNARVIELVGRPDLATGLFAQVQPDASGRGGNVRVNAEQLQVLNGAAISASTFGSGQAGNLDVNAQNIELAGFFPLRRSGLFASALIGTGVGGNLRVTSNRLVVRDGATINASNFHSIRQDISPGQGTAGNVLISAGIIQLEGGSITASTVEGGRGNVALQAQGLVLSQDGRIVANAQGREPGGNITLDLNLLAAQGNSDITANAVNARGGQINITTQALFGTAARDRLTSQSDITASSELGTAFNGDIVLNMPEVDPTQGLVELPSGVIDTTTQIVTACEQIRQNTFVITGRGGLPEDPVQPLQGSRVWQDLRLAAIGERDLSDTGGDRIRRTAVQHEIGNSAVQPDNQPIVEAQEWRIDEQGQISLIAQVPEAPAALSQYQATSCNDMNR